MEALILFATLAAFLACVIDARRQARQECEKNWQEVRTWHF